MAPPAAREAAQSRNGTSGTTAFIDVNVVPMDTERVLAKQTMLIEGGRITALGPTDQVKVPAGAVRIDGRGKYLIPGLADMHTHDFGGKIYDELGYDLFNSLASGVTSIRTSATFSRDKVQAFRSFLTTVEQLSPRFYLAGKMQEFDRSSLSPDRAAAAYKAAGYDFVQIDPWEETISNKKAVAFVDSLMAAARRWGLRPMVEWHEIPFEQMLTIGANGGSIEHMHVFAGVVESVRRGKADASEITARAAATQRAGTWVIPTLGCMEVTWAFVQQSPETIKIRRQLMKALQDAGVGILLGGEGLYVQNELALLVRAGLTPYQALLTSTRNVAQFMGLLDSSGTVAVGKRADLVLLNGNPLTDIQHTWELAGVMRAGRWFDRAELDRRLLARPKAWLTLGVARSGIMISDEKKQSVVNGHMDKLKALSDSLAMVKSPESERVLRLLTDEFGALRAILTPQLHDGFDMMVRVWLREQARKGYQLTVAGVAPLP